MRSSSQAFSPSTGSAGPVVRDMIRRAERFSPDKTAVVCGDERWTYRQFGTRVRKLAAVLTSLGVSKGDRVAVLMLNCHRYLELFTACFELGAIIVPLNTRQAATELIYTINDAEARLLVLDDNSLALLESIRPSLPSVSTYVVATASEEGKRDFPAGVLDYEQLLQKAEELHQFPIVREEDVAAFFVDAAGEKVHLERLRRVRRERDQTAVQRALDQLRRAAEGTENTMPALIEAARTYATLGEIMDVFRSTFGDYMEPTVF